MPSDLRETWHFAGMTVSNDLAARADHCQIAKSMPRRWPLTTRVQLFHWIWADLNTHRRVLTCQGVLNTLGGIVWRTGFVATLAILQPQSNDTLNGDRMEYVVQPFASSAALAKTHTQDLTGGRKLACCRP